MTVTWTAAAVLGMLALCVQQQQQLSGFVGAAPKQRDENMCRSVGALKFDATQRPMQRSKGLDVCSKYKKNTCCNETHVHQLRLKLREPVVAKFNDKCQRLTEEMTCAACHPFVGTSQVKLVCPHLCDDWYTACQSEYYAYSGAGSLAPCYGNALICSPLHHIAASGADFCTKMGFHVGSIDDAEGDECFDGSVPRQLGAAEPVEAWQTQLQRLFDEQSQDPSGAFLLMLFVPLVAAFSAFRVLRRHFDRRGAAERDRHAQLLEVRRLQQQRYGRTSYADYDSDSDSDSIEDFGDAEDAAVDTNNHRQDDDDASVNVDRHSDKKKEVVEENDEVQGNDIAIDSSSANDQTIDETTTPRTLSSTL